MCKAKIMAVLAASAATVLAACSSLNGPDTSVNNYGPVAPESDKSSASMDGIYILFKNAHGASYGDPTNGDTAMSMIVAGEALVKQNCDNYFDTNSHKEVFADAAGDALTLGSNITTPLLVAAKSSQKQTVAAGIIFNSAVNGLGFYHKQLTLGADFTESTRTMVMKSFATFEAAVAQKDKTKYTYQLAIQDLRDYQDICEPGSIIAAVKVAIASNQLKAAPFGGTSSSTSSASQGPAAVSSSSSSSPTLYSFTFNLPKETRGVASTQHTFNVVLPQPPAPVASASVSSSSQSSSPIPAAARIVLVPAGAN